MAFVGTLVSGINETTPVKLFEAVAGDLEVWIAGGIIVGGEGMQTRDEGIIVPSGDLLHSRVRPGDQVWALKVATTTPETARVLVRKA